MLPFFHTISTSLGPKSISRYSNCEIFNNKTLPHYKNKHLNAKYDIYEFFKFLPVIAGFTDE